MTEYERLRRLLLGQDGGEEVAGWFHERLDRRGFFRRFGSAAGAVFLGGFGAGADVAIRGLFGRGLVPVALAEDDPGSLMALGSGPSLVPPDERIVHSERPENAEVPPHWLDGAHTPPGKHFVRSNGLTSGRAQDRSLEGWTLTVDGEVHRPLKLTMTDLEAFERVTLDLMIECGGNGRAGFDPPVRGNPWRRGAVGCGRWTGVRLRDVLERAGLRETAVYTAHYGEDDPLGVAEPFSRGIPIEKALEEHTLIATALDGKPIPPQNGFPVRLVVPGWVGSCSQKWLSRIWIRDRVHDSQKMKGYSYRVPRYRVIPGTRPPEEDMEIATAWIVKSLITRPRVMQEFAPETPVEVAGHAWAGESTVSSVVVSTDFGLTWTPTRLGEPHNRYAWQRFETRVSFPRRGYYEIWARAQDAEGRLQPLRQPWNPKGYLGNVIHRLPVRVGV